MVPHAVAFDESAGNDGFQAFCGSSGGKGTNAHLFNLHARRNLGDAALAEAAVGVLRTLWPGIELSAATRYQEDDEWLASLGVTPMRPTVVFPAPGEGSDVYRAARLGASLLAARLGPGDATPPPTVALGAGGGYLFSRTSRTLTLRHLLREIELSARRGPTVLLPQSIGPLTTSADRRRVARALGGVSKVLVRDQPSLEVATEQLGLDEAKVALVPDLVFAHARPGGERHPQNGACAGMTVLDWRWAGGSDEAYERYLVNFAQIVETLLVGGVRVDLLVQVELPHHARQDDRAAAERVRRLLRRPERVGLRTVGETPAAALETYAAYDVVLGSRLHSALLALCAGTPALALGYQPKSAGAYHELDLADWALDARELDAIETARLAQALLDDATASRERARRAAGRARDAVYDGIGVALSPLLGAPRVWDGGLVPA